jgi:hypothetical protein
VYEIGEVSWLFHKTSGALPIYPIGYSSISLNKIIYVSSNDK